MIGLSLQLLFLMSLNVQVESLCSLQTAHVYYLCVVKMTVSLNDLQHLGVFYGTEGVVVM